MRIKVSEMGNREVAKYLLRLDFMVTSVLFIAVFSILFMLIYTPFSMAAWFDVTDERSMFVTFAFYIVAVATMIISKVALRWLQGRIRISAPIYGLWLLIEAFVITWLYIGFTRVILPETICTPQFTLRVFSCVIAILAIPYTIVSLYAAYRSQREENQIIRYREHLLGNNASPSNLINLADENGVVKLTIDIDSLYYIESQDNYVKIYYDNDGSLQSYMLRSRTKSIESTLANTSMLRCHRSYIVNTTNINVVRNDKSNPVVILKHPSIKPIPVSKSYYDRLISLVNNSQSADSGVDPTIEQLLSDKDNSSPSAIELLNDIKALISKHLRQK